MLKLRTTIRCNLLQYAQFLKIENKRTHTNLLLVSRPISSVQLPNPTLKKSHLVHCRSFAYKPDEDVRNLERVYYGTLTPRMRAVKVLSLTTSLAGCAAQPILMEQGMKMGGTGLAIFLCGFAGFFTFVTPVLLHFVTKKYVTEIHYNPATKEYVATTINIILQRVRTKFHPCDVTVPEVPGMFTSFNVGKKSLFVDPALFDDPEHYVRIMGYDKPIDFKLDLKEAEPIKTKDMNKTKK